MKNNRQLEFTNNKKIELYYDIFAGVLAIIATLVVILQFNKNISLVELRYLYIADKIIYGIFLLEFLIRVGLSKNKYKYIKNNFIDFIAILPFSIFTVSPYGSTVKLLRVIVYILRLIDNVKELLYINGFIYSLGWTGVVTFVGAFGMYIFERDSSQSIKSYGDALWWSFVTVTTVGYGDISPSTNIGRVIACILMLSGIGFLSMLTSTVSAYFINGKVKPKNEENNSVPYVLELTDLNDDEKREVINFYEFIKSKSKENSR